LGGAPRFARVGLSALSCGYRQKDAAPIPHREGDEVMRKQFEPQTQTEWEWDKFPLLTRSGKEGWLGVAGTGWCFQSERENESEVCEADGVVFEERERETEQVAVLHYTNGMRGPSHRGSEEKGKFRLVNSMRKALVVSSETFRMMSKRNFPRAASVRLDFLFHFLIKQKVKDK
jgi:hypothetical protein